MKKKLPWYKSSVIYQIYPSSFKDSNGDGVGDLQGIIEKLDYLGGDAEHSLGIGAIWLSPIYPSPMKDCGYDITEYCDVDPRFGNLEIFDRLLGEAHKRNIKIIMDLVTNHTSSLHPWFVESRRSKDNPKRDWYVWHDPSSDGSPPNNWLAVAGGPAWTFDEVTGQYYLHNFLPEQPDLNWRNKDVQNEMKKIIQFWLERGVDGFRVDAASQLIEDSFFRNDTPLHHYSANQPELKDVLGMICDVSSPYKDIFIASEAYLELPDIFTFYRLSDNERLAPFNFHLMSLPWEAEVFGNFISEYEAGLKEYDVPMYVFGNHDQPRVASTRGLREARSAALLLLTLRGTPFIYYGEEIGMKNGIIDQKETKDGFATSRDPERTPHQWDTTANAGFSSTKPWLPVSSDYKEINIETEAQDKHSMLTLYKNLIHFRNKSPALTEGPYKRHNTVSKNILAYSREHEGENLLAMINFSDKTVSEPLPPKKYTVVVNTLLDIPAKKHIENSITLRPHEGYLLAEYSSSFE